MTLDPSLFNLTTINPAVLPIAMTYDSGLKPQDVPVGSSGKKGWFDRYPLWIGIPLLFLGFAATLGSVVALGSIAIMYGIKQFDISPWWWALYGVVSMAIVVGVISHCLLYVLARYVMDV